MDDSFSLVSAQRRAERTALTDTAGERLRLSLVTCVLVGARAFALILVVDIGAALVVSENG